MHTILCDAVLVVLYDTQPLVLPTQLLIALAVLHA